jgi:FAD/FMN-containing dehydrogenase
VAALPDGGGGAVRQRRLLVDRPIVHGRHDGDVNRLIEDEVSALGGHKSLYSDAYYDEATFAALYGGADYELVKKTYDPDGRLPSLYDKAVRAR